MPVPISFSASLGKEPMYSNILFFITHAGNFSNGITTIQCMYAPEFSSHSEEYASMWSDLFLLFFGEEVRR
jgi:hypothetical protein